MFWVWLVWGIIVFAGLLAAALLVEALRSRHIRRAAHHEATRASELVRLTHSVLRLARLALVLTIGMVLILAGVVMLVTPGPGVPVMLVGLAVLATEFVWARVLLKRTKQAAEQMGQRVGLGPEDPGPDAGWLRRTGYRVGQWIRRIMQRLGLLALWGRLQTLLRLDGTEAEASAKLPTMPPALIITLDGPAGSGKSTVARLLAKRLGLEFLDTGAMYRGLTVLCLERGVDPGQEPAKAAQLCRESVFRFDWATDPPRLYVEHQGQTRDVTDRLRDADVTKAVSDIACNSEVRKLMVPMQAKIGAEHPRLVTEGRDQGSVVFPQAQVKFYLDADPRERAARRARQLRAMGKPADEAEILPQIIERDRRDMTRSDGPLVCPQDAIRVDTSALTLEQVVDTLETHVRQRCGLPAGGTSGQGA